MNMIRYTLLLLLAAFAGCQPNSPIDNLLDDYRKRIQRVTGVTLPQSTIETHRPPLLQLPTLKERVYEIPDTRMKVLAALDLLECPRLSKVVAYRNSSLGRQMLPSQRLHYEKSLILELSACIVYLQKSEPDSELLTELPSLLQRKRAQLPGIQWNALFGNVELTRQLALPADSLSDENSGRTGTLNTLRYVHRYLSDHTLSTPYSRTDLETHLQQLTASEYSGQLLRSVVQLTQGLVDVAYLLDTRLSQHPVCPNGNVMPEAERLKTVFNLLYAQGLQGYLSRIHKEGTEWRQAMQVLLQQLPPPPSDTMNDYLKQVVYDDSAESLWFQLDQAIQKHTQAWQRLLTQCELMPARPIH